MEYTCQYDAMGTTLLEDEQNGEYCRVFLCQEPGNLELGEITRGPLTRDMYDVPAYYHAVQLDKKSEACVGRKLGERWKRVGSESLDVLLTSYFADKKRFLADFMDDLDAWRVPYGYVSGAVGGRMSYRRYQHKHATSSHLCLVR